MKDSQAPAYGRPPQLVRPTLLRLLLGVDAHKPCGGDCAPRATGRACGRRVDRLYLPPGGPILNVTDSSGYEIRGEARRDILRRLPRYSGRGG